MKLGLSNIDHGNGIKMVTYMKVTGIIFSFDKQLQIEKNYENTVEKIDATLNLWKRRGISLLGRIQVVKTFAFSQIRFLTNFVEPPLEKIEQIKKKIFSFIWDNDTGRGKIKRDTAIADYDQGGLRVPDTDAILDSQKIMWIRRYICSSYHPWKAIFKRQLEKVGGEEILLNQSLDIDAIRTSNMEENCRDILTTWGKYNHRDISSKNISCQQIFYNINFKTPHGSSIFYKDLLEKGICFIKDVIQNNRVKKIQEIGAEKNLTNSESLHYLSVYLCIKNDVRALIQANDEQDIFTKEKLVFNLERESAKTIYNHLIAKKCARHTSEELVQDKYEIALNEDDWINIYSIPFIATIEVKLRSFQISLNHYYYFTNEKLHRIGLSETPNCFFCSDVVETINHLFVDCPYVQPLWEYVKHMLNLLGCTKPLTDFSKIFGFHNTLNDDIGMMINHILILVKHFIHMSKYTKTIPSVLQLKRRISDTEYLERQIALKKQKLEKHENKWKNLFFL